MTQLYTYDTRGTTTLCDRPPQKALASWPKMKCEVSRMYLKQLGNLPTAKKTPF